MDNFEALTFFHDPTLPAGCCYFSWVDMVHGSVPLSSISTSSASCPYGGVAWPSPTFAVTSCATIVSSTTFFFSVDFCATSCAARTSNIVVSFHLFSANYAMCNLEFPFFFWAIYLSSYEMLGACHSKGHASKIVKMASSMTTKGSFVHCFVGSLHTLREMLCISALNSMKLCRLL